MVKPKRLTLLQGRNTHALFDALRLLPVHGCLPMSLVCFEQRAVSSQRKWAQCLAHNHWSPIQLVWGRKWIGCCFSATYCLTVHVLSQYISHIIAFSSLYPLPAVPVLEPSCVVFQEWWWGHSCICGGVYCSYKYKHVLLEIEKPRVVYFKSLNMLFLMKTHWTFKPFKKTFNRCRLGQSAQNKT